MLLQRSLKYYWMIFWQNLSEAGSGIENIMTDRLNLGGLQVEWYISKSYTSLVNQALSRCFFGASSNNLGRWVSTIFRLYIMHASCKQLLYFMSFTLNLKKKKLKAHIISPIYIKNIIFRLVKTVKSVKTDILERVPHNFNESLLV